MAAPTDLVAAALREFGADTPTTQTVMRVAVSLAATVNRLPGLRGREKADLVLAALRQAISTSAPEAARAALLVTVDTVVPETLNLVVAAGRGELDFRRPSVGCLAAIAAALCRSAAAVSGDVRIAQAAAVVDNLKEGKVAEVAAALPMEEVAARAIGIATEAVAALETTAATASAIVAELPESPSVSTAPPTAPPTDEPSST